MCNENSNNLYFIRFPFSGEVNVVYSETPLRIGDSVKAESQFGLDIAKVVSSFSGDLKKENAPRVQKASESDLEKARSDEERLPDLLLKTKAFVESEKLSMKVLSLHIMFSQNKLVVIFTSNGRVDFRNLVKKLNDAFSPLRAQMHQVTMRESMALFGGLGSCGQKLCCTLNTRCKNLPQVNRKMLKDQNFKQDEFKVIGACEGLKCCLAHEEEFYQNELAFYPAVRALVKCKDGVEKVKEINVIAQTITLENSDGGRRVVDAHFLETINDNNRDGIKWVLGEEDEEEGDD